ncbi:MAG TPA: pyridoxal phosphate-dependent aminotransferase [Victivallales bacterium]|nr:pyridoxal phosphate-dependent aminotransferase [Victivallales bacterium]HPO89547.1 pyridoxal phosphate-dependent aminotransferase [Victivallales bacterium]HRU01073.1 pyridoxal phosphate-dependent aminotransferase [Victivallales bacterium]
MPKLSPSIPLDKDFVENEVNNLHIKSLSTASIREIVKLAHNIENKSGLRFIHMEMGVPGLPPNPIGVKAQIKALKKGIAAKYPHIEGIPELKEAIAKFAKLFMNLDISPEHCYPTVGSMQGGFAAFMTLCRREANRKTLFIDPGFPVQKQQHRVLGLKYESFDIYDYRGEKLENKLKSYLENADISTIVYSSPNNPSWIVFTEDELKIIGKLCQKYDVVAVEDFAYFAMDFRKDYSKPGHFHPSISKYTDNYLILLSSSKVFSYAGERISAMIISPALASRNFPELIKFFGTENLEHALIYGALYTLSSGTSHSAQYALSAMLESANKGEDFITPVKEYGRRAKKMKEIFLRNSFKLVYDNDAGEELADGFYFTLEYPGMNSEELLQELLRYGISAISLKITGSQSNTGIRACVSMVDEKKIADLEKRITLFSSLNKKTNNTRK